MDEKPNIEKKLLPEFPCKIRKSKSGSYIMITVLVPKLYLKKVMESE